MVSKGNLDSLNQLDRIELLIKAKIIVDDYNQSSMINFLKLGFIGILVLMSQSWILLFGFIALWIYFLIKGNGLEKSALEDLDELNNSFFKVEPKRRKR